MSENQASFEGWAKVEIMGHQSHTGYVRTEVYGQVVMFRVDQPEFPAREYTLTKPAYVGGSWTPAGAKVQREPISGHSVLLRISQVSGAQSIYRIIPCSEEAARIAIEEGSRSELKLIELPAERQLEVSFPETKFYSPTDRTFTCCGNTPEEGHADTCPNFEDDDSDEYSSGEGDES